LKRYGLGYAFCNPLFDPKQEATAMPRGWSNKDERQYEHIKQSSRQRGASAKRAEEIAARTTNKTRREEGRTPNKTTQGTGNPNRSLSDRSKQELYNRAQSMNIEGRSKMSKDELVKAIRNRG
jgi:plasmid stabilization system protein ParE